jgi:hypothetical protein
MSRTVIARDGHLKLNNTIFLLPRFVLSEVSFPFVSLSHFDTVTLPRGERHLANYIASHPCI